MMAHNFILKIKSASLIIFLLALTSCYRVEDKIEPDVSYNVHENYLKNLPSAFTPLTEEEKNTSWGQEYMIGLYFAKQIDLYRAITAFKRAEALLDNKIEEQRALEVQYEQLLCYYLGKRYDDVIQTFETSILHNVDKSFAPFKDLLVMLYDTYRIKENEEKTSKIQELLEKNYPDTAKQLGLSTHLLKGDVQTTKNLSMSSLNRPMLYDTLQAFEQQKKSVGRAQFLNAIIPGAGYMYIGQKKSALTSFLMNGLFIAAAYQFFHKGYTAAGVITTSFEMGWYFGGIYGAGQEAKYFNEKLYERHIGSAMNEERLFPIYMLEFTF